MPRTPQEQDEIIAGLEKLSHELTKADDDKLRDICKAGIDDLLDQQLQQRGAHLPACRCEDCSAQLGRFRHLGECEHPDDVASEGW